MSHQHLTFVSNEYCQDSLLVLVLLINDACDYVVRFLFKYFLCVKVSSSFCKMQLNCPTFYLSGPELLGGLNLVSKDKHLGQKFKEFRKQMQGICYSSKEQ